jgi:hypothetical protein
MARPTGFAAAVSCLTLALASSASATTYYATPTGSGSACSQAEPCDLPTAVGVAVTGDLVSVGSGSYTLADTLWIDQSGITIAGTPGAERPVIESAGQVIYTPQDDLRLRDLRISAAAPVSPIIRAASATLDRVDIATTSGSYQVISVRDLTLRDSVVRSATQGGVAIVTANATIVGSTIIANAHSASRAIGIARSYFGESPAVTRIGNSIVIGGMHSIEAAETGIDLSIDYSSYTTILGYGAPGVTMHIGTNNVGAPLLVDLPGRTEVHQSPSSPTINAGKPGELTTGTDYEGAPRLLGSAPDIGAHEIETTPGALATAADMVTDGRARLRGTITPGDRSGTRYSFEILSPLDLATVTTPVTFSGTDKRVVSTTMTFPPSTTVTYRVVATNGFGPTYSQVKPFRTAAPRPRVGGVALSSATIQSGTPFAARFSLSKRARVVAIITRLRPGRMSAGVCSLTATSGTRCTNRTRRSVSSSILSAGRPTVRTIGATPGGQPLAPGRYLIRVIPIDLVSGLRGASQTATFRVVR